MISAQDLVHFSYSEDLSEAGLGYARRAVARLRGRTGAPLYNALRRMEAGVAARLALQRHLSAQGIQFGLEAPALFDDAEYHDLRLAGRRCLLETFLITDPSQIADLDAHPELALQASALVPLEKAAADGGREGDLYVFCLATAAVASANTRAAAPAEPSPRNFLVHIMPGAWRQPRLWKPLAPLIVKLDSKNVLLLELAGQNEDHEFAVQSIQLTPRQRTEVQLNLCSLTHLHIEAPPPRRLGVGSPASDGIHLVQSRDWHDLWIAGKGIWVLGWLARGQFLRTAKVVPTGSKVFQFRRTRTRNLGLDASSLKPLDALLELARQSPL